MEALERYHFFYGDDLKVECPTGSGQMKNLREVAREIGRRLTRLFLPDESGWSAWQGQDRRYADDPRWKGLTLFQNTSMPRPAAAWAPATRPAGLRSSRGS